MIKNIIATLLFATNTITPTYADSITANPNGIGYMFNYTRTNQTYQTDIDEYNSNVIFPNMNFNAIKTYIESNNTINYHQTNIDTYNNYLQQGYNYQIDQTENNYLSLSFNIYFSTYATYISIWSYIQSDGQTYNIQLMDSTFTINGRYIKIDPIYFQTNPQAETTKYITTTQQNYNRQQWNEILQSTDTRQETQQTTNYRQYAKYYKNQVSTNYINVISNCYSESTYFKNTDDTQFYTTGGYTSKTEGLFTYNAYYHCQLRITEIDTYIGTSNAILTMSNNFKVDIANTTAKINSTIYISYDSIYSQFINLPMGNTFYYTSKLFSQISTLTNTWSNLGTKEFNITSQNANNNTFNHVTEIPLANGKTNLIGKTYVMQWITCETYNRPQNVQLNCIFNPSTSNVTHRITGSITYEVVDIPNLLFGILTMPFSFISTFFDIQLFPGTPYYVNIANLMLSIIAALVFIMIIRKLIKK